MPLQCAVFGTFVLRIKKPLRRRLHHRGFVNEPNSTSAHLKMRAQALSASLGGRCLDDDHRTHRGHAPNEDGYGGDDAIEVMAVAGKPKG
jgi:hypothetical protein